MRDAKDNSPRDELKPTRSQIGNLEAGKTLGMAGGVNYRQIWHSN